MKTTRLGVVLVAVVGCGDAGGDRNEGTALVTSASSASETETGTMNSGAETEEGTTENESTTGSGPGGTTPGEESSTGPDDPTTSASTTTSTTTTDNPGDPLLPPANAGLDYQLGGAYDPPDGVEVISRDRNAAIAPGLYNICYVNGYQTQPDEEGWWLSEHPDLLLRDGGGDPFIDPDWDEILLDITTAPKRAALAEIVGGWIEQCGADGYDAVEIDNLDTYSRSDGMISQDNAVDFISMLATVAHGAGMAIAQKNSAEILGRQAEMNTDFVVAEECNRYSECGDYTEVYGDHVLVIEYRSGDFDSGCSDFPELSIVLRDLNLVGPGQGAYVYDRC